MTFNPSIPQANDIISSSQPQILTNFTQLNTLFGIDHIEYDNATAANRGKHNKITFIQQAADPAPPAGEIALYTKNVGGTPRLFIQEQAPGSAIYQFSGAVPTAANPGSTWLPGGLIIKFGTQLLNQAGNTTINFVSAFPTNVFSITTCLRSATGGLNDTDHYILGSPGLASFVIRNPTNHAYTLNYIAIGN